jgi:predicted amidohydrolase
MRALLTAYHAPKDDLAGNLRRHVTLLELAGSRGCDLAVFPEFSLTGSVDPARHPERAVETSAAPVRELVADRTHLDLWVSAGSEQHAEVERLVSLGATRVDWDYPEDADFVVLADPEGNLFCVIE